MDKKKKKAFFKGLSGRFRQEKKLKILVSVGAVLLLGILAICFWHVRSIKTTFNDNSKEYLKQRADLSMAYFVDEFESRGQLVVASSDFLAQKEVYGQAEILDALRTLENSGRFDYALYVSNRGIKFMANGKMWSTQLSKYMRYMDYSKQLFVFKNFDPYGSEDEVCFGSPVIQDGIATGYIMGVNTSSSLFDIFNKTDSDESSSRYLVDDNGEVIVIAKNREVIPSKGKNFYDDIVRANIPDAYDGDKAVETILENITSGELSEISLPLKDDTGYMLYRQISETSGWNLFCVAYESDIQASLTRLMNRSLVAIIGILALMALLVVLIIVYISKEQKQIHNLAFVDELTEAPNENAFKVRAEEIIREYPDIPYMICCFDIMNFRYINEGYGHQKADQLLRALVRALSDSYAYNETFGRLTADKFIGLLVDDGRVSEREVFILDKLKAATSEIYMNYPIRIKSGIYYVRDRKEPIADMIDKANLARKSVDGNSRVLVNEYKDQLMELTRKQEYVESRMESALENGEFVPYLQPKWDMVNDHISGAEALVRWRNPDGSIVPPGDFIPIFETNGFIEKVDFYMLEKICAYIRQMIDENRAVYTVSINQSRYLMYNPDYISKVQEILLKYRIPKGLIEFELTETVFFHEQDRMISVMNQLKEFNMNLSIDDFGSGYSSLNLLRDIPFDVLKIDRGFLDESSQSESGKWILQKIVEMAEGLNLSVICEGVETQEQVDMLLGIGCRYAQGYLYSKPIPLKEFIERYNEVLDAPVCESVQESEKLEEQPESSDVVESIESIQDVKPVEVVEMLSSPAVEGENDGNTDSPI